MDIGRVLNDMVEKKSPYEPVRRFHVWNSKRVYRGVKSMILETPDEKEFPYYEEIVPPQCPGCKEGEGT